MGSKVRNCAGHLLVLWPVWSMGFFKPINVGKYVILFSVIVIRSGSHISEDGNIVDDATKWTHATKWAIIDNTY